MAKEFNIYLKREPIGCDILIYSLPFIESFEVASAIILDSAVDQCLLVKFTTIDSMMRLDSRLDGLTKIFVENLEESYGVGIEAKLASMQETDYITITAPVELNTSLKNLCYTDDFEGSSKIQFAASVKATKLIIGRYRLLEEMDDYPLSYFDDMSLEEIDYIIVSEE